MNDQTELESLYESVLLNEMPHISFYVDGEEHLYDMEIEKHQGQWDRMVGNTRKFLNGFRKDRGKARVSFLSSVVEYPNINGILNRIYGKDIQDLAQEV